MLSGLRLFAAADCIGDTAGIKSVTSGHPFNSPTSGLPSGNSRAMYRLATLASGLYSGALMSGMLSGRRLYAAERDPCCDGGPVVSSGGLTSGGDGSGGVGTCICSVNLPRVLYITFSGASTATVPLIYDRFGRGSPTDGSDYCWFWRTSIPIFISGTPYLYEFRICGSGFIGCYMSFLVLDSTATTTICSTTIGGTVVSCSPVLITAASISCSFGTLGASITETPP